MQFIFRLVGYALLFGLAGLLVPLAILNSHMVTVHLNPLTIVRDGQGGVTSPLFIVLAVTLVVGVVGGYAAATLMRWKRRGTEKLAGWRKRKQVEPVDVPLMSAQQSLPVDSGVLEPPQRG